MSDNNVTDLFGSGREPAPTPEAPQPRNYLFFLNEKDSLPVEGFGFLSVSPMFVCLLDDPEDGATLSLCIPTPNLRYFELFEDEVLDDTEQ